jgi:AP-3 complex subunit mu
MIQSLFILNGAGEQFFQKHWRGVVHRGAPDLFWAEVSRARHPRDVPPVLVTAKYTLLHIQRAGLYLLATVQRELPPLLVFEFLHRACDILAEYLKELTEEAIRAHFVTVLELMDELLDNGFPHTTEPNVLRELIPPPGLVSRVLQAVTGDRDRGGGATLPQGQLSNVPWRRHGVKYSSNEIYFDILEEVDAILDARGGVVSAEVNAEVMCNCKLSGMPDLTLAFSNAGILDDCSFHPCVRYARYQRDKVLSFVPPDGAFKLMSYRVAAGTVIPVEVRPTIRLPCVERGLVWFFFFFFFFCFFLFTALGESASVPRLCLV